MIFASEPFIKTNSATSQSKDDFKLQGRQEKADCDKELLCLPSFMNFQPLPLSRQKAVAYSYKVLTSQKLYPVNFNFIKTIDRKEIRF